METKSSTNSDSGSNDVVQINYYDMKAVEKEKIIESLTKALASLKSKDLGNSKNPQDFVLKMFDNDDVRDMCIHMSHLPVFSNEFA